MGARLTRTRGLGDLEGPDELGAVPYWYEGEESRYCPCS